MHLWARVLSLNLSEGIIIGSQHTHCISRDEGNRDGTLDDIRERNAADMNFVAGLFSCVSSKALFMVPLLSQFFFMESSPWRLFACTCTGNQMWVWHRRTDGGAPL